MREEPTCDELESLASVREVKDFVEYLSVVERLALTTDGDALHRRLIYQRGEVLPR